MSLESPTDRRTAARRLILRLDASRGALVTLALVLIVLTAAGIAPGWILFFVPVLIAAAALPTLLRFLEGERPSAQAAAQPAAFQESSVASLLEALPNPSVLMDSRGVVRRANASALALIPALRTGDPISFALRVPEVLEAVRAVGAGGAPRSVEYVDRVPVERWIEASVAPVQAGDGRALAEILVTLHEVTELKRVERMRVDFVANASHELRTPLASLLGFVETLQGPARNDLAVHDRFLEIMRQQATRMRRLIDDLLSLSRIEQKQHLRPSTPLDIRHVVSAVTDALAPLAEERGVVLDISMPQGEAQVLGDRDELIRVVENLVENGIKYGQSGGKVDVTVTREEPEAGRPGEVRIAVRDRGPGIAPEHVPRLTERFYRVDPGESRDKGGTGLGLAIVKHILARHRGRLAIESTPGEGSTFTAVIPAAPPGAEAPKSSPLAGTIVA